MRLTISSRWIWSLLFVMQLGWGPSARALKCSDLFQTSRRNEVSANLARGAGYATARDFDRLADRVEAHRGEFIRLLSSVDNYHGANYEVQQVIRTLRGVKIHEQSYLNRLQQGPGVRNVAVYGSTNIPLYTLILHAVIPASTGAHVWFRTPAASRETYVRLFARFKELNPELDLSTIHLLTDPADVQYDNFRKQYVLGMNRKGSRYERGPADVVLFTGNPRTGEEVRAQITRKLEETRAQLAELPEFRGTLFLKFGAGLNPVIVTANGRQHLAPAIDAAIEAIRINSSQDCIAPKFYVVHESVAREFTEQLMTRIGSLRYGERTDVRADYSNLTYAESVDGLQAFRTRWQSNLLNPQAQIDAVSKRVDPHVFKFEFDRFNDVELVDHYAPYLVIFTYRTKEQLERVANDPRVRERAMFASVFGDAADTQMVYLRKLFEDNFHTTILNQSIFVEESGNFPFGGYSASSSTATLLALEGGAIRSFETHRPLLYSKEAAQIFGARSAHAGRAVLAGGEGRASREDLARLNEVLRLAESPEAAISAHAQWRQLHGAEGTARPRGLTALRELGRAQGFWRVVEGAAPRTEADARKDELFFGPQRLYTNGQVQTSRSLENSGAPESTTPRSVESTEGIPESTRSRSAEGARGSPESTTPRAHAAFVESGRFRRGVVLHPTFIDADVRVFNAWRGDANPLMGVGYLNPVLFSSKAREYAVAQAVWPGSMPRSVEFKDLAAVARDPEIQRLREAVLTRLQALSSSRVGVGERAELLTQVEQLLQRTFAGINREFPHGAFVKNFNEFTTGDLGNQITTYSQNERNYARQFITWATSDSASGRPGSSRWLQSAQGQTYETGTKMIAKFLVKPEDLLIQQRVVLAKTPMGMPVEIRVDFIDGEAVHARPRYTHEYLGREMREAQEVLNQFFARAPESLRRMAGGADLAKLEDGRWMFMEFNFGSNSGTLSPELFPIEANLWMSRLRGEPTLLVRELESARGAGVDGMRAYLSRLRQHRDIWQKRDISEMSRTEVAKYFRDRALDQWMARPTRESGEAAIADFRRVIEGLYEPGNRELELLALGMENAVRSRLAESVVAENVVAENVVRDVVRGVGDRRGP